MKIKDCFINLISPELSKSIFNSVLDFRIKPEQTSIDAAVKFLSDVMVTTAVWADLSIKHARELGPPVPRQGGCRSNHV